MKTIAFLSLLIVSITACKHTTNHKSAKTNEEEIISPNKFPQTTQTKQDKINTIELGSFETYKKLSVLIFESITETEFSFLELINDFEPFMPKYEGDSFLIYTKSQEHKFLKYEYYGSEDAWCGYERPMYYPELKIFAFVDNLSTKKSESGELFLLDSITDYRYNILSFHDGYAEFPTPSPNNKYFAYFYNSTHLNKGCAIGVLKIKDKSNPHEYLTEYASCQSSTFKIKQLAWKSNNCFYIKAYEEVLINDIWEEKYKYYKIEVKQFAYNQAIKKPLSLYAMKLKGF